MTLSQTAMTITILALTAGCASQGEPAANATTAMAVTDSGETTAAAPVEKKSTKLVCRRIKPTGSRMTERVCMRPEQWQKYSGAGRKEMERLQRGGLQKNLPGG